MGTHFFTSITANYLPKARVLARSIRKFHPFATIHIVFSDEIPSWLNLESEPFDCLITLEDLPIPNLPSWLFQHTVVELSTAVKGFALRHILAREDCEHVVYLDPDIVVLSSFDTLLLHFQDASILLTPHQLEPEIQDSAVRDNELLALRHGIFNLGFLGVKNSGEGNRFAQWWTDRLQDFCFDDVPAGLFTDQRWADFIPAFFPDHKILRDPGYNVATWNLSHRRVEGTLGDGLTVNGRLLVFYHFSGLDSGSQLGMLQRYGSDMPALFALREWYLEQCDRDGEMELNSLPWAYGFFANGEPILKAQRRRYRQSPDLQARYPNPFECFEATASVPAVPAEAPLAPYRIFLIAAPADEIYLDETLRRLLRNTVNKDQLWLVANTLDRDIQSISVNATRYEEFAAHILRTFGDKDIVLVRAGALTPPQWDLRLAWTAARHPDAFTISPVDRRFLDNSTLTSSLDPDELDRLCYFYREGELEVASYSPDCVYSKASGLRSLPHEGQRSSHLLATHICLSFLGPQTVLPVPPSLRILRDKLRNHSPSHGFYLPATITSTFSGATLHILHSSSGDVEQWIRNFSETDAEHEHLVLKSVGPDGIFAGKLYLYRYGHGEPELLDAWSPNPPIRATAVAHRPYQEILSKLQKRFPIERVIVSSLIGHSLDCLRTGLPTMLACPDDIAGSPGLRSEFSSAINKNNVRLIAHGPSPAAIQNAAALPTEKYSSELYFSGPHAPEPVPNRALQLYWSEPNGHFSEHTSFVFAPFHMERQTARLYIPATKNGIAQLRLDLGSKPGIISIHQVTLFSSDDQRIWSAPDARCLLASATYRQIFSLSSTILCLSGNDPQLTFQLPETVLAQLSAGGYMDVDFAWRTIESHTADLLDMAQIAVSKLEAAEQVARLNADIGVHLKNQLDHLTGELEKAWTHTENVEASNRSMQTSLSWKLTKPVRLVRRLGRKASGGS